MGLTFPTGSSCQTNWDRMASSRWARNGHRSLLNHTPIRASSRMSFSVVTGGAELFIGLESNVQQFVRICFGTDATSSQLYSWALGSCKRRETPYAVQKNYPSPTRCPDSNARRRSVVSRTGSRKQLCPDDPS